ncbi:MAG: VWA domain-containing protein [Ardenticatenia bacterium]|nr:VWA domain-containing protein [Ardenticatenia bacterium]
METSTRPLRRSGLAILVAATIVTTAVLSAVVSQPAGVTAQGPRATPGRPTPDDERSPCTGVVTSTLSTNTLRVCDVLTNTVRLQPGCPFCLGGVSIVFVQPERVVGLMTFWMPPIVEQMLQALELYQKEFERNYNHPFLVQAGVVHYDATRAKTIVRMTSQMNLIRAAVRQAQDGAQDGGPYPEAAQLAIKLLDSAPRTSEAREAGGVKPCLEVIVFFGSHENSTEEIIDYSAKIARTKAIIRARTRSLFSGCTGWDTLFGCGWYSDLQPDGSRSITRFQDTKRFRFGMMKDLRDVEEGRPEELVEELSLTQHLPPGFSYVAGSGIPEPAAVITTGDHTVLRWDWDPYRKMEAKDVTYSVRPGPLEGVAPIEGGMDLKDVNGLTRFVPMASQPITVTGLCIPPTATPTDTPVPTLTPTDTDTPVPTPTATATATASPTATRRPSRLPIIIFPAKPNLAYLPLMLHEACRPKQQRVDVVLVMDASTSMNEVTQAGRTKMAAAQAAARTYLDELQLAAGDQAAIVTFNKTASLAQSLTSDRAALDAALGAIVLAQQTCLVCGVDAAAAELQSAGRKADHTPVMILLTDGRSNPRPVADAEASAAVAKAAGVMVFTIGIGDDLDADALAKIASRPEFFFRALDAEVLSEIYRAIAVSIPCPPDSFWGRR